MVHCSVGSTVGMWDKPKVALWVHFSAAARAKR